MLCFTCVNDHVYRTFSGTGPRSDVYTRSNVSNLFTPVFPNLFYSTPLLKTFDILPHIKLIWIKKKKIGKIDFCFNK